jgi:hypothetical protein
LYKVALKVSFGKDLSGGQRMAGTATDLIEYAEHCARLARLISDAQICLELEQLAEQLKQDARRLELPASDAAGAHEPGS